MQEKGQRQNAALELVLAMFSSVQSTAGAPVRFCGATPECSKTGNTLEPDAFSHLSGGTPWKESTAG